MTQMKETWRDYLTLTKPRICVLALLMTAFGYGMALDPETSIWEPKLFWSLAGIGLVGAACGILNQYIERDLDSRMERTKKRPLVTGKIKPERALAVGVAGALAGEIILLIQVNDVTAALAGLTIFLYLAVYTPSKRVSTLSTLIGAVPGAMPPLLGWTAASGTIGFEGLILFGILFLWQIPHFLAIGWLYREDYSRADFPILTVVDRKGSATAKQIVLYSLILLPVTLMAGFSGIAGQTYSAGAALLGGLFLAQGVALAWEKTEKQARRLFFASLLYLPLLGFLMVWDRM